MLSDLAQLAQEIVRRRHSRRWKLLERSLPPRLLGIVDRLIACGRNIGRALARVLGDQCFGLPTRQDLAVAAVKAHALLGRAAGLLRSDRIVGGDLLDALVRTQGAPDPQRALLELVTREAASRLNQRPTPQLRQRARDHIAWFRSVVKLARSRHSIGRREIDVVRLMRQGYTLEQIRDYADWLENTSHKHPQAACLVTGARLGADGAVAHTSLIPLARLRMLLMPSTLTKLP